jgi:hypothetical protein
VKAALLDSGFVVSGLSTKISSGKRVDVLAAVQLAKTLSSAAAYQPNYVSSYKAQDSTDRSPASEEATLKGGGCGSIAALGRGNPPTSPENFMFVSILVVAPLLLSLLLGRKSLNSTRSKTGVDARRHNRFKMNSEVRVMVGDRELIGNIATIGAGGVSFNADAMLEKGGIVTMSIQAPDGTVYMASNCGWDPSYTNFCKDWCESIDVSSINERLVNYCKSLNDESTCSSANHPDNSEQKGEAG